ncbi:hypothetical protein JRQ81_008843 [Phrynocephalus forsythii]|uniref:V-type proton ATPase subunit G n=1 Tax=Phrynocephalus forsythii TaxID=171643 RepID=A0A9Q0XAS2_9SAUR|nr:hypothetical protein JRQ81_008843 [Phrynocephalus forsythii]
MASQSQGIQQLLQAEKRAAEKVAEARKRKNRRLKQAKEEAQAEIEQYRLQREKEFKAKEEAFHDGSGEGDAGEDDRLAQQLPEEPGGGAEHPAQLRLRHQAGDPLELPLQRVEEEEEEEKAVAAFPEGFSNTSSPWGLLPPPTFLASFQE